MNIIAKRKIFLTISGLLVAASILAIAIFGFNQGIDFKGGTFWQIKFLPVVSASNPSEDNVPSVSGLQNFMDRELGLKTLAVLGSAGDFIIRAPSISEAEHQDYLVKLKTKYGDLHELSFQSIGPTIGHELRERAITAVLLVLVGISLYIAFAFRKASKPVASWKYGVVTLVTLFHDIALPTGMMAVFGKFYGAEIDTNFMVAILVILGFSVHDTIVVFDRIRENLMHERNKDELTRIVNMSVNDTMFRSINTSLTLIIVLLTLLILGPDTLTYFILALLLGVVAGTYSSIFVASPLLTVWHDVAKRH
ncbi:MAG: protein translocase subunit SecF [Candidatus Liptonbacteria bacterium]|nr:protein translocase subunit SecF [Candidatus Liptonbacteria bacterium]